MTIDLSSIETLTKLAEQFGPFLFAILFILFVPRVARGYYDDCVKRTAPPSTEQEQKTYRFYFVSSVVVGIAVMAASIGWWIYTQARGNHVYQIAIIDLEPNETVLSDFYFKNNPRPTMANAPAMHDAYFLIVQDHPFSVGDTIRFQYFKIPTDPAAVGRGISGQRIEVKYTGGRKLNYRIKPGESGPKLEVADRGNRGAVFTAEDVKAARSVVAAAAIRSSWP